MTSTSKSTLTSATVYGNKMDVPLLLKDDDQELHVPESLTTFKRSALFLGFTIGLFIQFSTLGANYLAISKYGSDVLTSSKKDIVLFSILWSFFTSSLAIVILGFLRNLVASTYQGNADTFDNLVLHMECRFVVGALVGVCLAWAGTDAVLGLSVQIVYSLMTLVVALVWCRLMMYFFSGDLTDDIESMTQEGKNQERRTNNVMSV